MLDRHAVQELVRAKVTAREIAKQVEGKLPVVPTDLVLV